MKTILNLTMHPATPEQKREGVIDMDGCERERLCQLLTFNSIPDREELRRRASKITVLAYGCKPIEYICIPIEVMIAGFPALMPILEHELLMSGMLPVHSFSKRVSAEVIQPDGTVIKTSTFKHIGFIRPYQ